MKTIKILWVIAAALVMAGSAVNQARADWEIMSSITTENLYGIWGSSGTNVFAVGTNGTILNYNGSRWRGMTSDTATYLWGVWGSSANDVFAVGFNGTIVHYNGSNWTSMPSNTTEDLFGVWGSSANDVFAVGFNGTILHYNGSSWDPIIRSTTEFFRGIWGSSASDVFAVGERGTILHYNGSNWAPMTSDTMKNLFGVWGSSASDVFAVGESIDGTILHYNGSRWSPTPGGTTETEIHYGIWGSSASDVFAVGAEGTILHYNGSSWATMTSGTSKSLFGIWGSSASDVFAVGSAGTILHYTAPVTTTTVESTTSTVSSTTSSAASTTSTASDDTTTTIAASTTTSTAPEQVTADFMVSPSQGYRPLTVNFTNLSQGTIDTSVWAFGDGEESTDRDPVHVYRTPGTYSVSLKVFGSNGTQDTMVRENCISVMSRCAIGRTLNIQETVVMLRVLRNVLLANPVGVYLVSRYYAHAEEIGGIFDEHEGLRRQFRELVRENRGAAEELIVTGSLEVSTAQAARIIEFLRELREVAGPRLGHDIALLIKGIEDGWLLNSILPGDKR